MAATIAYEDLLSIVHAYNPDPFTILGAHPVTFEGKEGVAVRAFLPHAKLVYVVEPTNPVQKFPMPKIHQDGFFEVFLPGKKKLRTPYKFECTDFIGNAWSQYDPYGFLPVLGDMDLHLLSEGTHYKAHHKLGNHSVEVNGVWGVVFAVWAPMARRVSIMGDFNQWDGRRHCMRKRGSTGIWELFIPELTAGQRYKYEIMTADGTLIDKGDPYAFCTELRPRTASVTGWVSEFNWSDQDWMKKRAKTDYREKPMSIYEVHLGSWMRVPEEDARPLTYRELAERLIPYVKDMGYTHIELLPVAEHMFGGSWGYQVTSYFAPTRRFGSPEDLQFFINKAHELGIGVILDWVPAHFPKDAHSLARFDGSCLYEHADPRQGEHADWGTLIFNYGRHEVRNFLISNALFWLEEYHIDGLRVDAVASMLYLDYSRPADQWVPNKYGGKENLEAIDFLKILNEVAHRYHPGVITIAEESTSFAGVSRPTYLGGLGFDFKWNMGWMHDFLAYMSKDPLFRKHHHSLLTFDLLYAFTENFCLSLSHDEVVHGKGSLLRKMPGDEWQRFANLRVLCAYMWGHPGKKLNFMGNELAQWSEWAHQRSLDWHLLDEHPHKALQSWVRDLNHLYQNEPCLYELDHHHEGFQWIDFSDADHSIISFMRKAKDSDDFLVFVLNFTPVTHYDYRCGVARPGFYTEVLNSDAACYWGSNDGNAGGVWAEPTPWQEQPHSISLTLPPLSALILKPEVLEKPVVEIPKPTEATPTPPSQAELPSSSSSPSSSPSPKKKPPAKKATTKKPPAKKATTKKPPAQKATTKKTSTKKVTAKKG